MAKRTDFIELVANTLRRDVFRWTKANFDKNLSGFNSWTACCREQERFKGVVEDVMRMIERCDGRIILKSDISDDHTGHVLATLPGLFAEEPAHSRYKRKFFIRARR